MTGATIILIILGIFAAVVGGSIVFFLGRTLWARRNPQALKEFEEREAARRQKQKEAENERIRLGKPSWTGRAFGAVFTFVGIAVVVMSIWQIYELTRGQFWTEASCMILKSGYSSSTSARSATTFRPEVEYSYNFQGQNYTGKRLMLASGTFLSATDAQKAIKKYRRGEQTVCFVNPENPSESVLDRSFLNFPLYQNSLALIICFGLGAFLFYSSRRRKPQNNF